MPTAGAGDHPRRCGENKNRMMKQNHPLGSPPQVRGKLKDALENTSTRGITPAGAGKTLFFLLYCLVSWDHPRRCGENHAHAHGMPCRQGSPPQVRGKLSKEDSMGNDERITPAGAGKTKAAIDELAECEDHPRRCGENYGNLVSYNAWEGSPPQVRVKPTGASTDTATLRITPAGAGKTLLNAIQYALGEDHPRRCGENRHGCGRFRKAPGSPPQVRGKLLQCKVFFQYIWITPAGAGKTSVLEHESITVRGSPPQVRGKLQTMI